MKTINFRSILAVTAFAFVAVIGMSVDASAQGRSGQAHEKNRIRKEQKQYEKAEKRYEKDRRQEDRRYRVYRDGSYYQTDHRGADLLRQAVNAGYQQGYQQGQQDRRYSRDRGYYGSNVYRNGNYGYRSYVDRQQYQYYFQQGFQRGYQDGYNSQSRYGYNSGGSWKILQNVLGSILNIREY